MRYGLVLASLLAIVPAASVAVLADQKPPYTTTIACGDITTARILFGDSAQACTAGRDAAPTFLNVRSYETYYHLASEPSCDESCLRPLFGQMKRDGEMRTVVSGDRVTVLSASPDPEDKHYRICRIKTSHGRWLVGCLMLADSPQ